MIEKQETFYRIKRSKGKTREYVAVHGYSAKKKEKFSCIGIDLLEDRVQATRFALHADFLQFCYAHEVFTAPSCLYTTVPEVKNITKALSEYAVSCYKYYLDDSSPETSGSVFAQTRFCFQKITKLTVINVKNSNLM
jgi:hypothetical protein